MNNINPSEIIVIVNILISKYIINWTTKYESVLKYAWHIIRNDYLAVKMVEKLKLLGIITKERNDKQYILIYYSQYWICLF